MRLNIRTHIKTITLHMDFQNRGNSTQIKGKIEFENNLLMDSLSQPKFKLDTRFVNAYSSQRPSFGFNALGEIAYKRSYSRLKEDGSNEEWYETVERVVNGSFNLLLRYSAENGIPFDYEETQKEAQKMYKKIFEFKFLPPGRGLWAMGTKLTEEKHLYASLNNCAFVSTGNCTDENFAKPFIFLMDMSMLGVGVGFDTKGAGIIEIKKPDPTEKRIFVIEDSREGWVESTKALLESYFIAGKSEVEMDYSKIRPEGILLKGFGGISSGPEPLRILHKDTRAILDKLIGKKITSRAIVDIMNMVGRCIVAGNIRRTAEIAFGEPEDEEFLNLKNYEKYPERESYGWTSNNSIFASLGMDYSKACENIRKNGEPGFCWLENMRAYGRMCDSPNYKDIKACGGNPCLEQTLESYEMCCLVETFPFRHDSYEEFEETLKYAFMYSKIVTLGLSHWKETNEVISRNRRIGTSMSGIAQFLSKYSLEVLQSWCQKGYEFIQGLDAKLSEKFKVNRSIKTTCVKPSGTVSLLAGATPGLHFPESRYYIRRIRFPRHSTIYSELAEAGYKIEEDAYSKDKLGMVAEIPVCVGTGVRSMKEVSMYEQLEIAAFMQKYWADNQVSCTIQFDPKTEGPLLTKALEQYQYKLKGISFLPRMTPEKSAYVQMPYEEITEKRYLEIAASVRQINTAKAEEGMTQDPKAENFCDGDKCNVNFGAASS